jgi:hypothetical protein
MKREEREYVLIEERKLFSFFLLSVCLLFQENRESVKAILEDWRQRILSRGAPNFTIFDVLSAQDDLTLIRKTSYKPASLQSKTEESLKKIVIGDVPDRGGRVGALRKMDPSMPKFQPRGTTTTTTNQNLHGGPQRQQPPNKKQRVQVQKTKKNSLL